MAAKILRRNRNRYTNNDEDELTDHFVPSAPFRIKDTVCNLRIKLLFLTNLADYQGNFPGVRSAAE